jgi:ABC-type antimicrobial peptide transport system permease subunit
VGLFAILSLWVGRKTSEIGLRMALGAGRSQIRALVLRQIAVVLLAGIAAGLALSLGLGQVLESIAYGLPPGNPALLACAVVLLLLTALAAALVPARRAASIEPLAALRQE